MMSDTQETAITRTVDLQCASLAAKLQEIGARRGEIREAELGSLDACEEVLAGLMDRMNKRAR